MTHRIGIDRGRPLAEQPEIGHNRWHPDLEPVLTVAPGETLVMETKDAMDGQITSETSVADLERIDRNVAHPLTGPVAVAGAEPGDMLAVIIDHVEAQPFGWTANNPGFGFLRDHFEERGLTRWSIAGGFATSEDIPGVRIPGAPFMGVMGVAPSRELQQAILAREAELLERGGLVKPPDTQSAVPESIGVDGLRTGPPRENAGNVDIRHLVAGTTVFIPVYQPGALFSAGDAHFAQGDGEVCGTGIEMGATLTVRFEVLKGGAEGKKDLSFQWKGDGPPPGLNLPGRYHATTGVCVHPDGRNESEDATLAARNALLNMIDYIEQEHGLNRQQAYHLCSVAVNLKLSQVVDLPNILVTALLPLDIFTD